MSTDPPHPGIAAVVLAAGRGRRMGRSKATLPWGPTTLCEAWIRRLLEAGVGPIAAVLGPDGALVRAQIDPSLPVIWATNPDPDGSGMRESLLIGLDALPADSPALFTPVDVPVVGLPTLQHLRDAWEAASPEPLAVLPRCLGRSGHPVLAGPRLIRRLFEGEPGDRVDEVLGWASRGIVHIDVDDERVAINMNRPDAYQRWAPRGG